MEQTGLISIVVPVKDEANNVAPLAREIAAALRDQGPHEILFIDDGSSDTTVAELQALKRDISALRVLVHARNLGQSRAVRTGVIAARGAIIVTLDGDGQNNPADIPKLLSHFADGVAMVAGERQKRQDTWRKRAASRAANAIRRKMLGDGAKDTGCGLKAFRREAFLVLPYFDHMHRYLITLMLREGLEVRFVPVSHRPRQAGQSKYGNLDRALVGISDILGVRWLKRRFRGPAGTKEV